MLATLLLIFAFQAENLTSKWFAVILLPFPSWCRSISILRLLTC